jgi:hypothetical protein
MMDFFSQIDLLDFNDELFRNIRRTIEPKSIYNDLSDEANDWKLASRAEKQSDSFSIDPIINQPFDENFYNHAIQFPFNLEQWRATRYSRGDYGVWYGALEFETSIHETVFHWKKNFIESPKYKDLSNPIIDERRVFTVNCQALLLDFRNKADDFPALIDNDYTFCQTIGERLNKEGHPGILSKSARAPIGNIAGIFTPKILKEPKDHVRISYTFNPGTKKVLIREADKRILFEI